jgi:hypothetical protein
MRFQFTAAVEAAGEQHFTPFGRSELHLRKREVRESNRWRGVQVVSLLSLFATAVAGYHPYAEDGGIYVAGIEKLLDPTLFRRYSEFVTEHLRFSIFAPAIALLVRASHCPLPWVLFGLYVAAIWATLYAGWMLAARVTATRTGQYAAVTLLACWLTLPIAGTSLMLMDPYLTARSFSTPLGLMALAGALDARAGRKRAWVLWPLALTLSALVHPLMAAYSLGAVLVMLGTGARSAEVRRWSPWLLLGGALLAGGMLQWFSPAESAEYVQIALTRSYWFPALWHWYELIGLAAPLFLLWRFSRTAADKTAVLARTGLILGGIALAVALLFAHPGFATHFVARLQPLRAFQIVYEIMILLLGSWLGERWLRGHAARWGALLVVLGAVMFLVQHETYPHSAHLEWPESQPANAWEQAFVWAREHTPKDALFALDADYVTSGHEEDAQCFRAISQRSSLPDRSKDGGEASITPSLTGAWIAGQQAQTGLETETDAERVKRLGPLGVTWVILEAGSRTAWTCPYRNATVKVCRLP